MPFAIAANPPAVTTTDIMTALEPVTSQFSVANITGLIVALLGITVVFAFLWWGMRYAYKRIFGAATGKSRKV